LNASQDDPAKQYFADYLFYMESADRGSPRSSTASTRADRRKDPPDSPRRCARPAALSLVGLEYRRTAASTAACCSTISTAFGAAVPQPRPVGRRQRLPLRRLQGGGAVLARPGSLRLRPSSRACPAALGGTLAAQDASAASVAKSAP
jgi:hypothetical protein